MIMSVGGLAQGVSFLLGKDCHAKAVKVGGIYRIRRSYNLTLNSTSLSSGGLIVVPTLGPRPSLALATLLFSLAPVFAWASLTYLHTR